MTIIRLLEELSMNARPALQAIHYDGWILRFSGGASGYPRRSNSIQVLYPSTLPLDQKIDTCEAQYRAREQKTVFKMTPESPEGLDALLRSRGYVEDAVTAIQTLDLAALDAAPIADDVQIEQQMSDSWFDDCARLHKDEYVTGRATVTRQILDQLAVPAGFARLRCDGETAALGMGVLDQGWIGLYEIVTDAQSRQRGFGRRLVESLLQWGRQNGAHSAYLQVMISNAPALHLYQSLGFREQYRYWYLQTTTPVWKG
ncbi:MAG TPA: GNAT family N-acetyltransferase [Phototrophicaceae bacterium]|nr:GNAT family N-acetyltransferase [Phototrophicaceae bacterium]